MTTPGYKKCTLCGEEMIIDAILCPYCGRIPGGPKGLTPRPNPPAPRRTMQLFAIALCVGSLAVAAAGLARSDATLLLTGAAALALAVSLWFAGR